MKNTYKDKRINVKNISWQEYIAILCIMLCLNAGQAIIFYLFNDINNTYIHIEFIFLNIAYWAFITLCLCFVTSFLRKKTFIKPIDILNEAFKKVAEGDFSVQLHPLRKDGKKDNIGVIFDDFNLMIKELSTIETLKTDFIANVSHEIKTPLAIIENYTTALQKKDLTDKTKQEYTNTIIDASKKLGSLISNILKLSKLENQEILPTKEKFDICAQLCDCILAFEEKIDEKNITLDVKIDERVFIFSDKEMFSIVWNNLLSNAIKFTKDTISITHTVNADTIIITITDNGCGMDGETIKHIFDKFYQSDASRLQEGNGLGLALTMQVIELLGGQITVKSTISEGASFSVYFKIK